MRISAHMGGFTLLEAIMVIVITGILAVMMASFAKPLEAYFGATHRADLSDVADTALRRMARELHTALPNSVRVSGNLFVEFLPTITGGRYRGAQNCTSTCTGNILDFDNTDTSFDVIGTLSAVPAIGNELVVYNLGSGVTNADAYSGNNVAAISASTCTSSATLICFSAKRFPLESPASRFHIINGPVTFACDSATSTLWRYSGYARQATQPASISVLNGLANVSKARLATNVDCASTNLVYAAGVTQRSGLVSMRLSLVNGSEKVTLLHQVHVPNVP